MKSRFRSNAATKEETEDTLLRAMLYEPFPGNAAVVLSRLGFLGNGLMDGLGARTFDAESGRLSLTMDDGRVVELERSVHPHIDNRYAVSVQSREGVVVDQRFILIDRNASGRDLGVTDLQDHRMAYVEAEGGTHEGLDGAEGATGFEPGTLSEVRVEEPEGGAEPSQVTAAVEVEEEMIVEEEESTAEMAAEDEALPQGDFAESGVDEAEGGAHDDQRVEEQIYSEPEIAEDSGSDAEPEAAEVQEAVTGAEVEAPVEAETGEAAAVEVAAAAGEVEKEVEPEASAVEAEAVEPEAVAGPALVRKVSERERSYGPLFQALEANEAVLFGWVAETGTIQTYEHKETGRYLHLDAASGLFYDQTRTPISKSAALKHTMRPLVVADAVEAPVVVEEEVVVATVAGPDLSAAARVKPQVTGDKHGEELGLDAFVRKADEPEVREGGRDSWRSRFAGLGKALKMGKNANGRGSREEEKGDEPGSES